MLAAAIPAMFSYKSYIVYSGSMEPAILTGAVVVDKTISPVKLKPGDIITFRAPTGEQRLITHRIVAIVDQNGVTGFRTKGDANRTEDTELVPWNLVVGKYVYNVPFIGYLLDFANTTTGKIAVIAVALLLMLLQPRSAVCWATRHRVPLPPVPPRRPSSWRNRWAAPAVAFPATTVTPAPPLPASRRMGVISQGRQTSKRSC